MKNVLILTLALVFVAISFSGCTWPWSNTASSPTPISSTMMSGSDRDSHGCIPSAGYTWCEAKQKCLRTWEEPCQ